jgi:Lrp/AsnC family transcriptional regulator for asnA, asnC and gidA
VGKIRWREWFTRAHSPALHPQSDAVAQLPGLDDTDKAIISVLQRDGRRPLTQVAAAVGLSEAAVRQRVTRLTTSGAMQIVAVADPSMLGYQRRAMIGLSVEGDVIGVADRLAGIDQIDSVVLTAGSFDLLLEVVVVDDDALLDLLNDGIRSIPGVRGAETFVYLRHRKQTYAWGVA